MGQGGIACPKPKDTIKRLKGRKDRAEAKVAKAVRAACVERDGVCRVNSASAQLGRIGDTWSWDIATDGCDGPSEWCHMHIRRRSQTRNQAPEIRHSTRYSFIACRRHHDQYDGRQTPRLLMTALSAKGADGPLKFRRGKSDGR